MALYDKYGYQFSDFARRSLYEDPELLKIYPYLPGQLVGIETGNGKISRARRTDLHDAGEHLRPQPQQGAQRQHESPEHCAKETAMLWTNVLKGNFMIPYQLESYDDTVDAPRS